MLHSLMRCQPLKSPSGMAIYSLRVQAATSMKFKISKPPNWTESNSLSSVHWKVATPKSAEKLLYEGSIALPLCCILLLSLHEKQVYPLLFRGGRLFPSFSLLKDMVRIPAKHLEPSLVQNPDGAISSGPYCYVNLTSYAGQSQFIFGDRARYAFWVVPVTW